MQDVEAALQAGAEPLIVYQAGCAYALLSTQCADDYQRALQFVARALQADPGLAAIAAQDRDLVALHEDPVLRSLLSAANTLCKTPLTPETP